MKIMVCPLNGPRPVIEFAYGGEVRVSPDPETCSDADWSAYVFNRSGSPRVKYEWWCHIASGYWFIALRDTARDVVLDTFSAELARSGLPSLEVRAEIVRNGPPTPEARADTGHSVLPTPEARADTARSGLLASGVREEGAS
jgi:sarcosine oxidase subunit delta